MEHRSRHQQDAGELDSKPPVRFENLSRIDAEEISCKEGDKFT